MGPAVPGDIPCLGYHVQVIHTQRSSASGDKAKGQEAYDSQPLLFGDAKVKDRNDREYRHDDFNAIISQATYLHGAVVVQARSVLDEGERPICFDRPIE